MALKTILFVLLFLTCSLGALGMPLLGVLGYMAHYVVGPEDQWWTLSLRSYEIHYSRTLAVMAAVGIALNWQKLELLPPLFSRHEKLMLLFLGVVWFSVLVGEETVGWYLKVDHPSVKLTKAIIFVLMLTHVVTNVRDLNRLLWVLVVTTLLLSLEAYGKPRSVFASGRLEGVGGVDFRDANFFAAFLVCMLPLIGVQLLRSGFWGKILCLVTGVLATDGIILTRSRGAFLSLVAVAITALWFAPKRYRATVIGGMVLAALGGYRLMDTAYLNRISTITLSEEERDRSAASRIEIWIGGGKMLMDNPLGVGAGNFMQAIGRYMPRDPNRDAHNSFVRCGGELGVPGLVLLVSLFVSAWLTLRRASARAVGLPAADERTIRLLILALNCSLAATVCISCTMTLLYVENFWWFLAMPVCVSRAVERLLVQHAESEEEIAQDIALPA